MDDCARVRLFGLATPDCAEGNDTEDLHHSQQSAEKVRYTTRKMYLLLRVPI